MIPDEQLDFGACVSSGQVFRFRREGETWAGMDGDNLIEARKVLGGWEVGSTPDPSAWKSFLQIDVDLTEVRAKIVEIEPRLARAVEALPGLRPLRPADPEETAISFLCTPNNHMSRIVRMASHLASYGWEIAPGHFRFPSVAAIARADPEELRKHGFGYRATTIPRAAEAIWSRGPGWLTRLKTARYENARKELLEIPGVGPKLADCISLFALHFDSAVPIDTHVWKVLGAWRDCEAGTSLTPARYESARLAFGARFGCFAGWAQQYVFYERFQAYRNKIDARFDTI